MENILETDEVKERIKFILKEYGEVKLLDENCSVETMNQFLDEYNWDDGLEVPYYFVTHSNCDLGTALKMFYLSDGLEILDKQFYDYFDKKWVCFVDLLFHKIKNGEFSTGKCAYKIPLSKLEKEKIRKTGKIADVFLNDV